MKTEGDTNNKVFVRSITRKGTVKNDGIKIHEKPDSKSKELATLAKSTEINIFGRTNEGWFAIEYKTVKAMSSAFIPEEEVALK